jgi:hypothetical protein
MARQVLATITEPTGRAREGLMVFFHAPEGYAHVTATADASGVIRPVLETGVTYRVSVENAVIVDGVAFPAGTIILVQVPEGEGPATAREALTGTIDASRPALLDREAQMADVLGTLLGRMGATDLTIRLDDLLDRIERLRPPSIEQGGTDAGTALSDLTEGL